MILEQIFLSRREVDKVEDRIIRNNHIRHYIVARRFVWGRVMDIACGCGYGSYLLSKNPDVREVFGIDRNQKAIQHAEEQFESEGIDNKLQFCCYDLKAMPTFDIDVLVSLETIEHLEDPYFLFHLARRFNAKELFISFPRFKTTHFNSFHKWDLTFGDVTRLAEPFFIPVWHENSLSATLVRFIQSPIQPTFTKRVFQ